MTIVGTDRGGNPIGVERGLFAVTLYRARRRRPGKTAFLSDLGFGPDFGGDTGGGGGFDWETLWTGLNPVLQGVGARISGGNPYPNQPGYTNPYLLQPPPTASASISPMLMIGGLGLAAIMLMKK